MMASASLFLFLSTALAVQTRIAGTVIGFEGNDITFKCQTASGNCGGVAWNTSKGYSHFDQSRVSFYSASGCNLLIKSVRLSDAERIMCLDKSSRHAEWQSTYLIVVESEENNCETEETEDETAEGDDVNVKCKMTFRGTTYASIYWGGTQALPPQKTAGKTLELSNTIPAKRPVVPSFYCLAAFQPVNANGAAEGAIVLVTYCKTKEVKILYGVEEAKLFPPVPFYIPGTPVFCVSDGNPKPEFQWQASTEKDAEDDEWLDVPDAKASMFKPESKISLYFRCTSREVAKGGPYKAASSTFMVEYSTTIPGGIPAGIGIGVGIVIVLTIVIVVIAVLCGWLQI